MTLRNPFIKLMMRIYLDFVRIMPQLALLFIAFYGFQSYDLFPNKTVLGNIVLVPVLVQKRQKQETRAEVIQLLERVGLSDRQDA